MLSKAVTSSFLTLVKKSPNLVLLDDYRPVYLIGCIYKDIVKLLAGRLKRVSNSINYRCQSCFVSGRHFLD